jgi:hypothetical protein
MIDEEVKKFLEENNLNNFFFKLFLKLILI